MGRPINPNLNKSLKGAIVQKWGSQVNAAHHLGIDEYRLSRILNGRSTPSEVERELIARVLRKPLHEIFPGR